MRYSYLFALSFLVLMTACAPTSQMPTVDNERAQKEADIQREIALKDSHRSFERLQKVSNKILLANVDICGKKVAPFYGITPSSTDLYPKDYKDTVQRLYGLEKQPTIYYIAPRSPAAGKLKMSDIILAVNGKKIKLGKMGMRDLENILNDKTLMGKATSFTIDRNGVEKEIAIQPEKSCAGHAVAAESTTINAFADGNNIIVTTGMMDFAKKDNELALVVGHELAHNSRKHIEARQGNAFIGMLFGAVVTGVTGVNVMGLGSDLGAGAFSQGFEAEADYVGLYHTSRAGYDISDAPNFWRRMGAKNPAGIHLAGTSHPSTAKRFVALENTVEEINKKKASKSALLPEEISKEEYKREVGQLNQ